MRGKVTTAEVILAVVSVLAGPAWCKGPPAKKPRAVGAFYRGTIGKTAAVQMSLLRVDPEPESSLQQSALVVEADKNVTGRYFYERVGTELTLSGKLAGSGVTRLKELDPAGKHTGTFVGKLDFSAARFAGTWYSADGRRRLPFLLSAVAEYRPAIESGFHCLACSVYPVFRGDSPALQRISQSLREKLASERAKFLKDYTKEAKGFAKGDLPTVRAELVDLCAVKWVTGDLVSVSRMQYSYTWGAHGNTEYVWHQWRIEGAKATAVALGDLFRPGTRWRERLAAECTRELNRQQAGWFVQPDSEPLPPDALPSFYLTPAGITFVFPPYAAGCYAEGSYQVTVPVRKFQALLQPSSARWWNPPSSPKAQGPGSSWRRGWKAGSKRRIERT